MNQNTPEEGSECSTRLGVWLPIETAPRNGTEVLVLLDCAGVAVVRPAWYRSREEWEDFGQYFFGWDRLEEWEGWWSYASDGVGQEKLKGFQLPTHWQERT
jgi:hypothetical protein